jgi:hypothetical protein
MAWSFFNIHPANERKHNKKENFAFDPENIKIIHLLPHHPSSPRPPALSSPGKFCCSIQLALRGRNSKGSLSGSIKIFVFCFYVKCIQIYS